MNTKQNSTQKKTDVSKLLGALVGFLIGAGFGVLLVVYMKHAGQLDQSFGKYLMSFALNLLICYAAGFLQFVLHEGGHLVFGALTGYHFVSFRVGSLTLVKTNEGIKCKRMTLAGTGGQCLMSPPEWNDGNFPYKLYNFGGFLMNFISAIVSFVLFLCFRNVPFLSFFLLVLSGMGVAIGLMNGIPLRMGGLDNDGRNVLSLSRDKNARWSFWFQLAASAELAKGKRLKDLPAQWFDLPDDWRNNPLTATVAAFRENLFMDTHEFDKAEEMLALILDEPNSLARLYLNMLLCDRMYLELINTCDKEKLNQWNTKEHQQFRLAMKNYITVLRTEYALALLKDKDSAKAEKILLAFEKRAVTHPNPGEAESERELIELAKQKAAQ